MMTDLSVDVRLSLTYIHGRNRFTNTSFHALQKPINILTKLRPLI